jgi:RNA-directed DNA polymerase
MHQPLAEVGKWLRSVVQGYFNYHAVPGNIVSLRSFRLEVSKRWMRALRCRSQKSRITWKRLAGFVEQWLPPPKILHPYPYFRFDAKYLRWEPHAVMPHVRNCAGGAGQPASLPRPD